MIHDKVLPIRHVPQCMSCHNAIVVISGRAHCFHDCIYIMHILLLWDLSTLCVVDHLWPLLEGGLLKLMPKHFKSGGLWTMKSITRSMVNWKKKKEFLLRCISKILFIDTEKFSKMKISLQLFFKNFADRFGITYPKNGFLWSCFSKILLIHFRIATNLNTGLSKKCSWKVLFIDFKTASKII